MLEGLDEIGTTLEDVEAIQAFERQWRERSPWLFDVVREGVLK